MRIPSELRTKKIQDFMIDLVLDSERDFDSLTEIKKDEFVSLCIEALDDIEIVLSGKANKCFSKYISTYDSMDSYDFIEEMKKETREQFRDYFEHLFLETLGEYISVLNREIGLRTFTDVETGETAWA